MSRQSSIVSDKYGIDPLKDKVALALKNVTDFQPHVVSQDEIGHMGLLALRYYSDETLGFIILEYNALGHELDMYAGQDLRIPSLPELSTKTRAKTQTTKIKRSVSI